jgi:signal peptidase I
MTSSTQPQKTTSLAQEAKSLLLIAIIALFIRTFIIEPFFIPTGSMKQTLLEGEYVFATKYSYGYSKHSFLFLTPQFIKGRFLDTPPERGDIIIFKSNHDNGQKRYIKRLIGVPGDKVQMISGVLYVNDKTVSREYLGNVTGENGSTYKKYAEILPNGVKYNAYYLPEEKKRGYNTLDNTKAFNVPEGNYFFMGDNRNESGDSRLDIGFVPFENLIAKAQFMLFSTEKLLWLDHGGFVKQVEQVYHWVASIRWSRLFHSVYGL